MSVPDAENLFKSTVEQLWHLANSVVLHRLYNTRAEVMFCSDSVYRYLDERATQLLTGDAAVEILAATKTNGMGTIDSNGKSK